MDRVEGNLERDLQGRRREFGGLLTGTSSCTTQRKGLHHGGLGGSGRDWRTQGLRNMDKSKSLSYDMHMKNK